MQDLKTSTDDLTKDWPLWVKRVFAFSKLEAKSRGSLRDLLSQAETTKEGISKDGKYIVTCFHTPIFIVVISTQIMMGYTFCIYFHPFLLEREHQIQSYSISFK